MKFSIRDLLLVTVIAALAVGWGIDRWRVTQENLKLKNENDRLANENAVETERYMLLLENTGALERALDEVRPGWRKADGTYDIESGPGGTRIPLLPTSQAPAPNPPQD